MNKEEVEHKIKPQDKRNWPWEQEEDLYNLPHWVGHLPRVSGGDTSWSFACLLLDHPHAFSGKTYFLGFLVNCLLTRFVQEAGVGGHEKAGNFSLSLFPQG
jgi:hypothetical protein